MPIRPENRSRYPKDWPQIRERIRKRSGNSCECTGQCGIHHATPNGRCDRWHLQILYLAEKDVTVILTVAHLDHQPEHNDDANLLHMCQGCCHNRYDMPMRRAGIQARKRAAQATGDLFQCEETR